MAHRVVSTPYPERATLTEALAVWKIAISLASPESSKRVARRAYQDGVPVTKYRLKVLRPGKYPL